MAGAICEARPMHRLLFASCRRRRASSMAEAIGQPYYKTHPDVLKEPTEVLPGIRREDFAARRAAFAARLPAASLAVIPGYRTAYSSLNIFYPFQQNNNLLYLTGFNEPDCALTIEKDNGTAVERLYVQENDASHTLWSGPRAGCAMAVSHFGVAKSEPFERVRGVLSTALSKARAGMLEGALFIDDNANSALNDAIHGDATALQRKRPWLAVAGILDEMRLVKSPAEVALLSVAASHAARAFVETIKYSREHRHEGALAAKVEFECKRQGSSGLAYVPVVAGGDRANVIHYVRNDRPIEEGSLVLMDAGAKYMGYCSDITRCWPISGTFSTAQRDIYQAVLNVQLACIAVLDGHVRQAAAASASGEARLSIADLTAFATLLFGHELEALGFCDAHRAAHTLFPHSIGHYIGLDLHDCQTASTDAISLQPGMVVTIEPGLYIPADPAYPAKYHGIGVRIEDDIALSATDGCVILSEAVPKEISAIEALLAGRTWTQSGRELDAN